LKRFIFNWLGRQLKEVLSKYVAINSFLTSQKIRGDIELNKELKRSEFV
jgi:hypothetical protein